MFVVCTSFLEFSANASIGRSHIFSVLSPPRSVSRLSTGRIWQHEEERAKGKEKYGRERGTLDTVQLAITKDDVLIELNRIAKPADTPANRSAP